MKDSERPSDWEPPKPNAITYLICIVAFCVLALIGYMAISEQYYAGYPKNSNKLVVSEGASAISTGLIYWGFANLCVVLVAPRVIKKHLIGVSVLLFISSLAVLVFGK